MCTRLILSFKDSGSDHARSRWYQEYEGGKSKTELVAVYTTAECANQRCRAHARGHCNPGQRRNIEEREENGLLSIECEEDDERLLVWVEARELKTDNDNDSSEYEDSSDSESDDDERY